MSKNGATILVVDDEREIVRALRRSLSAHGYTVLTVSTGEEALEVIAQHRLDLLLLDLVLPGMSGLEVCRRVRETSNVPIIVLSVKGAEHDKVEALDLGADDYVAKPFGMSEVLARVRVALRRAVQPPSGAEPRFHAGPLSVDFAKRRCWSRDERSSSRPPSTTCSRLSSRIVARFSHGKCCCKRSGEPGHTIECTACMSTWHSCVKKSSQSPSAHGLFSRCLALAIGSATRSHPRRAGRSRDHLETILSISRTIQRISRTFSALSRTHLEHFSGTLGRSARSAGCIGFALPADASCRGG